MGNVVRGRRRVFLSAPDLRKERGRRDSQVGKVNRIVKLNCKLVMHCAAGVGAMFCVIYLHVIFNSG